MLTTSLLVPGLLVEFAPGRTEDFSKGLLAGLLAGAGFGYAQYCFLNERQRGTLDMLLHLPIQPRHLVRAKFLSVYSMTLFTVGVPAFLVRDPSLILIVAAVAVFVSTLFMTATVVSDKPWAPQVPIWILVVFVLPAHRLLDRYFPSGAKVFEAIVSRPELTASMLLLAVPVLVVVATEIFARRIAR